MFEPGNNNQTDVDTSKKIEVEELDGLKLLNRKEFVGSKVLVDTQTKGENEKSKRKKKQKSQKQRYKKLSQFELLLKSLEKNDELDANREHHCNHDQRDNRHHHSRRSRRCRSHPRARSNSPKPCHSNRGISKSQNKDKQCGVKEDAHKRKYDWHEDVDKDELLRRMRAEELDKQREDRIRMEKKRKHRLETQGNKIINGSIRDGVKTKENF